MYYPLPMRPPPIQYYSRATTVDFRNPSIANIQQVLKESWPTFALAGAAGILLGATKIIPWSNPTLSFIIGGTCLAGAGYGYMLSNKEGNNI